MMPTDKTHTSIRRIREEAGLSQAMMADELGIGRTTYINFETGKVNLYCKTLSKFASLFRAGRGRPRLRRPERQPAGGEA